MNEFFIALIILIAAMCLVLYIRRNHSAVRHNEPDEDRFLMQTILHFVKDAFNEF